MTNISYTSRAVERRLSDWIDCGHGEPELLSYRDDVRHPERVEILTHFQLAKHWYAMRWCEHHHQAHIEWFVIDVSTASQVVQYWSSWIQRSNPYDRRGVLKGFWQGIIEFLAAYEVSITAEMMDHLISEIFLMTICCVRSTRSRAMTTVCMEQKRSSREIAAIQASRIR
jgi:hypothetical protein